MKKEPANKKSDTAGHRDRLRKKFVRSGLLGFNDYEIVELLLIFGTPRRDTKQAAKEALHKFRTLRGVLDAPAEELQKIRGIGPVNTIAIKFIQEIARRYLKDKITEPTAIKSSHQVFEYLYHSLRGLKKELFKILYLNSQNQILAIDDKFEGTVNCSAVSPREVVAGAIKYHAVSLIFAHNHPSGNPEPSQSDKDLTRDLIFAAETVHIKVLDHIIIGNDRYFSFAGAGLIEQGESSFQALKMKGASGINTQNPAGGLTDSGLPWTP